MYVYELVTIRFAEGQGGELPFRTHSSGEEETEV